MKDDDVKIMTAKEVAVRALALFGVWLVNTPTPRKDVILWLKNNDLWNALSPEELKFVETEEPTREQQIDFSWHIERLYVLTWALGLIDEMVPPNQQGTISEFQNTISPLNASTSERFLKMASLRDELEIWEMGDQIERAHWTARNAKIKSKPTKMVDLGIIQERHHAINWILWGREEKWDEVSTDT